MKQTAPIVDLLPHLLDGGVAMFNVMNTALKDGADMSQPERALTQGNGRIVRLEQPYFLRCSARHVGHPFWERARENACRCRERVVSMRGSR